jgi:hypothetical protein
MTIKDKIINWAFGNAIREQAVKLVRQSAASSGIDPDESQWRRITRSRRDMPSLQQDKMIEMTNYIARTNPLGNHIFNIKRDFLIGKKAKYEANDKTVIQDVLDEFWNDPINKMKSFQFEITEGQMIAGEVILPTFVNEVSGFVRLGWIDPLEVSVVAADMNNRRLMSDLMLKPGAGAGTSTEYDLSVRKIFQIINVDTNPYSKFHGYRTGNCFFNRINCAADATRGRSDFYPLLDWLDAWDQSGWGDIERNDIAKRVVYQVTLNNFSKPQIDAWLQENGGTPPPGAVRANNQEVKWEVLSPNMQNQDSRVVTDGTRKDILGAAGLSNFFFGDTDNSNHNSSENLELPILRGLESRQERLKIVFEELGEYVIDQKAIYDPKFRRTIEAKGFDRSFEVKMPELSSKDLSRVGSVLAQIGASLDLAVERKWITKGTAAKAYGSFMSQFGIDYDAEKEMQDAEAEATKNEGQDYPPGKVAEFKSKLAVAGNR